MPDQMNSGIPSFVAGPYIQRFSPMFARTTWSGAGLDWDFPLITLKEENGMV
jgi:hypothetical protein